MSNLPSREESLLKPGGFKPVYPKLDADMRVDTVIVGGGITGITTAYLLRKAGQKVAILEKDAIGSGTTGHTTGKVTSQHNLMYADMYKRLGPEKTRIYGHANQEALATIRDLISTEKIDCGWEDADNFVYTAKSDRVKQFKQEAKIAAKLGLPASFEESTDLPFKITGAVKFSGQGHMNAQKYIEALAKKIIGGGSYIFESTRVTGLKDGAPGIVAANNHQVAAGSVIITTNVPTFPLMARGAYCVMEYPHSSYLIAGNAKVKLKGMYISPDDDHYSLLPIGSGNDQILLVGGQNHIPGLGIAKRRHQKLTDYAQRYFDMDKITYRWHARDYLAYDNVPLIGKLYPWSKNMYVATAFKKWGMSHSMVAATILRDAVLGKPNPWARTFNSQRFKPIASIPRAIVN